jgi:hypothetical protein
MLHGSLTFFINYHHIKWEHALVLPWVNFYI